MSGNHNLFEQARTCQRSGDLRQARELYRRVVQAEPYHAEAWHSLALCHQAQGELQEAADAYAQLLRLRPSSPDVHCGLGNVLAAAGRRDAAAEHFQHALRLQSGHADALLALGTLLGEAGRPADALPLFQQAIQSRPDLPSAHHNLGVALAQLGRTDEAVSCLQKAVTLRPDYAEAHCHLGNLLRDLRRLPDAEHHYRTAISHRPSHAPAFINLGLLLTETNRHAEAMLLLRQATRLAPTSKEAWNNLGLAYSGLGELATARSCYEEALRLSPDYAEAHANLGSAYKEEGRLDEALASYQLALWYRPDLPSAHYNRSLALLQAGDYERGWTAYEWRWKRPTMPPRPFSQPRWDGSPLEGKTILLWCEQGLGDALQFVRYAALVKERGGKVLLECPPPLVALLQSCPGVDRVIAEGEPLPDFDVQVPLLSLPGLFGTTLASVPASVPYLHADPERVAAWREKLTGGDEVLRVGVVWQGNPRHGWDRWRSFPLSALLPLAAVPGVRLISLQKGHGSEQLQSLRGRFAVADLGDELDPGGGFADTAAVMANLDLVVSADTAAAHLAGALGAPTWMAVAAVSDWRWLLGRDDSTWYPTLRLFRQRHLNAWDDVFQRMTTDLKEMRNHGTHEVLSPLSPRGRGVGGEGLESRL
jgi:tetratricopeptide (TPR) repeat protein